MFLRPKRFGKSLWVSMLEHYYDVRFKDQFQELFGKTEIGRNPTPLANSFLVLSLDFSTITLGTVAEIERSFTTKLRLDAETFCVFHKNLCNWPDLAGAASASEIVNVLRQTVQKNGLPPLYVIIDEYDNFTNGLITEGRAALKADVARMREAKPDFVVMGMHAGGQYNPAATKYTKELVGFLLESGVDIISGTHEHVVHGSDFSRLAENKLVTYSLGNFNGVSGVWLNLPERRMSAYSIAWHVYFAKRDGAAKVVRTGFSVLKTVAGAKEGEIAVVPVADLFAREEDAARREALRKDVIAVVQAFAGRTVGDIRREY